MKICIVSSDKRYIKVNELLCRTGLDSTLCSIDEISSCDVLILSLRDELNDTELKSILDKVSNKAIILCGNEKRIKALFSGSVIDYSQNEELLQANAYLTAEATISYLHSITGESLKDKKVFIAGYGRIGQKLSKLLSNLGAHICVYARRKEIQKQIEEEGFLYDSLESCVNHQIIINTVPFTIFKGELIDKIPKESHLIELASSPYGFENMQRVNLASGLPGKVLSNSGARVVFDTIINILSTTGKE